MSSPGPRVRELAVRVRSSVPRLGPVRLVCVDGPAGSGKTTLASALAAHLERSGTRVTVVRMDDLYEGWTGLEGVWGRVEDQVLRPLASGGAARYQRYDWVASGFAEWVDVPPPDVLVLEGCGSARRDVDGRAALVVWVEAPPDLRLERGLARDGESLREEWLRWRGLEAAHFEREATRDRADVHVDGSLPLDE